MELGMVLINFKYGGGLGAWNHLFNPIIIGANNATIGILPNSLQYRILFRINS